MSTFELSPGQISTTLGAVQIGAYIAVALFGLMTMQSYHYYNTYPNDKVSLKLLVAWIWCLETVHTILITRATYVLSVDDFGHFQALQSVPFMIKLTILFDTIIAFTVQTFFTWRLRIMSNRWELASFCWSLTVLRTVTSFIAIADFIRIDSQAVFFEKSKVLVTVVEVVSAVNDVVIAIGLCYYLSRSRSGIVGTDQLLGHLMKYIIQSGILTSIISVIMLICFLVMPDNWIWIAVHIVLAKPFSNSFLAMLNARQNLRTRFIHGSDHGIRSGGIVVDKVPNSPKRSTFRRENTINRPIEIEMTKVTMSATDEDFPESSKTSDGYAV